jgi:hypothetical protein
VRLVDADGRKTVSTSLSELRVILVYVHVAKDTCFGKAVEYREHSFGEPTADTSCCRTARAEFAMNCDEFVIVVNVSVT